MMNIRSEKQDQEHLRAAFEAAKCSLDPSTKVGGILLHPDGRLTPCFNTFLTMEDEKVAWATREERYADVLHAEESGLMELGMDRAKDCWYFGTHEPCGRCWKLLAWMGISRVVYLKTDGERRARWSCDSPGAARAKYEISRRHPNALREVPFL